MSIALLRGILYVMPQSEDDTGSLERARKRLYETERSFAKSARAAHRLPENARSLTNGRKAAPKILRSSRKAAHASRGYIFAVAFIFFLFRSVSRAISSITEAIRSRWIKLPLIPGSDQPLPAAIRFRSLLTITNKNSVAIENATIEIDFPDGNAERD